MTKELTLLKSKLHRATVTDADLDYEGSISIDRDLMDVANFLEFEKVEIYNISNGERFATYVIEAPRGSKTIGINGAAAWKAKEGDKVIICAYVTMSEEEALKYEPIVVLMDEHNEIK